MYAQKEGWLSEKCTDLYGGSWGGRAVSVMCHFFAGSLKENKMSYSDSQN